MDIYQKTYTNISNSYSNFLKPQNSRNLNNIHKPLNKSIDLLSSFRNMKFLSDSSINKYYKKYIQKQAHIQHQQKIYELIEKMDDLKAFNSLKAEYLKEKELLQNIHNRTKNDKKRVIYDSRFINLNNCEEKLNSIYKLSSQDLNFMSSFMHFLGNRPKKIIKPKINKKLEALSRGKLDIFLKKKELSKQESNTNTLNNYNPYNTDKLIVKNKYINNNDTLNSFGNIKGNKANNKMSKTNDYFFKYKNNNIIRRGSLGADSKNKIYSTQILGKTNSTNFGLTNYNFFMNNAKIKKRKSSFYDNNIRTENITNSESQNDISNIEEKNLTNNNTYSNKNVQYNRTKSKLNSQTSIFSLNNNKSYNRSKNSTSKINKETASNYNTKQKDNTLENIINNKKYSTKFSEESDINKNNYKDSEENNYEDISLFSNMKKADKRIVKNKLIKIYKNTMNEFLQRIKDEEKDLHSNGTKLSALLYNYKKYGNFHKFSKDKNIKIKNIKTDINRINNLGVNKTLQQKISTDSISLRQTARNNTENLIKEKVSINQMTKTFYPSWGKSKYNIPYINKIIYGEENNLDPFEQLQKDLFFKVKTEIRKSNMNNKKKGNKIISINGKEILKQFKNNKNEEEEESEIDDQ